ncbi:inner membrane protein, 60 kDa [Marinomonas sp. MED121]|uniref:membrane protein insertase YidC n=1 Tax=Marinomonas sp. MED121 TaxID=314277 RepID=UPI0000690173|nr:membrane protein insertase YidC [Marinomonas sp. MED121]EAQ63095.1 inner membrane protein, 60 kDa [Marinomonas sp. MED121]
MDFRRYFLWGALFVVGYMLFLQWNQDYGSVATSNVAQTTQTQEASNNTDLPSTAAAPVASNDIVVDAKLPASDTLIRVVTDALIVSIDPVGGDIVKASLPEYKKAQASNEPFVLLDNGIERIYVTQSGLVGPNGPDASKDGRPVYRVEQSEFKLGDGEDSLAVNLYFTDVHGVQYTKTFTFQRGEFAVRQQITVDNNSNAAWQGNLFAQIKRDNTEDPSASSGMGLQPYLGGAISTEENPYTKVSFSDMAESPTKITTTGGWIALLQHYFVSAWVPDSNQKATLYTRQKGEFNIIGFTGPSVEIAAGTQGTLSSTLYIGPKLQDQLSVTAPNLELTVDYGWLWWLAQPLFWLLTAIQSFVINWGVAIILVVVVVKALFFKLSAASYRSMAKMRKFGPELTRLREQHGDDRQKMSAAMMELYKKEKINPLGGCLPILVQMPVFLALYWVLMESVELRHAPFMLWINDLSAMDPYFVLPILMGISMLGQQMLNPTPPDPMQARIMKIMPIAFTFFFLWFPSGLVLYWVVNNTLSILQQYVITKRIEREA